MTTPRYGWGRSSSTSTWHLFSLHVLQSGFYATRMTYSGTGFSPGTVSAGFDGLDAVYTLSNGRVLVTGNSVGTYTNSSSTSTTLIPYLFSVNIDGVIKNNQSGQLLVYKNYHISSSPYTNTDINNNFIDYRMVFSRDSGTTYIALPRPLASSVFLSSADYGFKDVSGRTGSQTIYLPEDITSIESTENHIYIYSSSFGISKHDSLTGKMLSYYKNENQNNTGLVTFNWSGDAVHYRTGNLQVVAGGGTSGQDKLYFCNSRSGKLWVSLNSGETWSEITKPANLNDMASIYVSDDGQTIILASRLNLKTAVSTNGGTSWSYSELLATDTTYSTSWSGPSITRSSGKYYLSYWQGSNSNGIPKFFQSSDGVSWEAPPVYYGQAAGNIYDTYYLFNGIPYDVSNSAPTDITLSPSAIVENSPAGSTVGSFSAVDVEGGAMVYSLVAGAGATDNSSFVIEGNALKTAAGVSLDYENKSSYSIRVKVTDSGGMQFEKQLSVSVTNVNEVPSVISLSAQSISESAPVNSTIGVLSAVDPEGNAITYSVVSGGDKFNISGNALRNSVALDYEAATSHAITIRATDSLGATKDQSFTISVTDILTDNLFTVPAVTASTLNFRAFVSTTDPKSGMVKLSDGSALPVGSFVRFAGKRHMKLSGGAEAFVEITNVAKPEWGWSQEGEDAWETLDSLGI